jgi:hypothetical protein
MGFISSIARPAKQTALVAGMLQKPLQTLGIPALHRADTVVSQS